MANQGKSFTIYSTNPKMGQAKGYADGGRIPEDDKEKDKEPNLQLAGGLSADKGRVSGGGRVGYTLPLDNESDVTVGVSGSVFKDKNASGAKVTGGDVTYRNKNTTVGVSVEPDDYSDGKKVMLKFGKMF